MTTTSPAYKILEADVYPVYIFHGVIEQKNTKIRNYNNKHITAQHFENFLKECLSIGGIPHSIDQLIDMVHNNISIPEKAFFITFDDGFLNNLTIAAPILAQYNIPATFYICTDFVERNRMSWIDRIEYVFEMEDTIHLPFLAIEQKIAHTNAEKIQMLDQIRHFVKSNPLIDPDQYASEIQTALQNKETWSSSHILDQKLTWKQVEELSKINGMTIGGHTHNHAMLSHLNDNEIAYEIDTCLHLLREKSNIETCHFSYPEGQASHYDERCIKHLKNRNITCSPSAIDGLNNRETDLFHLKRIMVT